MKQAVHSPKSLGRFIQRVRKFKNLTQSEIGGKVFKFDQSTISSIEQGAPGTRLETIFRLVAALDLEIIIQTKDENASYKNMEW